MKNITCLISGNGTNLNHLIQYLKNDGNINKQIKINYVISNNKNAYGINYALQNMIPYKIIEFNKPSNYKSLCLEDKNDIRNEYDSKLFNFIADIKPDILYCLGWDYILGENFISNCQDNNIKIINLHPSLPNDNKLIGLHSIERAYQQYLDGEREITGIMVHNVIKEVDKGEAIVSNEINIRLCESKKDYLEKIDKLEKKTVIDAIIFLGKRSFLRKPLTKKETLPKTREIVLSKSK